MCRPVLLVGAGWSIHNLCVIMSTKTPVREGCVFVGGVPSVMDGAWACDSLRSRAPVLLYDSYLVDPASSHMLVSKIKPCMSKYKQLCTVKLQMAH
jgi:hypothetical protein